MYTKLTALALVAFLATVLVMSTIAMSEDADARKKSQKLKQSCSGNGNCQNAASQIQGRGNTVVIVQSQSD